MKDEHFTLLTNIVWKINDLQVHCLISLAENRSLEETPNIVDVEEIGSDGRGKIRYLAGWTLRKEIESSRKYIKNNLYSTDKKVHERLKLEYQTKQSLNFLTVPETLIHRVSKYPETLRVTDSRQYSRHGLIHVTDETYLFFLKLEQERIKLLTIAHLHQQHVSLVQNAKDSLLNNSDIFITFQNLFLGEHINISHDIAMKMYSQIVSRYINMGAGQFLKDYRREVQLKKTQAHRKKIATKDTKTTTSCCKGNRCSDQM
ncbi:uncharacterized protein [Ptychodera flava]|uniref:uncharacterized protein n=1 Tax=Ptychodera flava TaxID=63121 RepID=UPI00396A95F3